MTERRFGRAAVALALAACACTDTGPGEAAWQDRPAAPVARVEGPAAVLDGRLYVFGGFTHYTETLHATARVDVYDPGSREWSRAADLPVPLTHMNPAVDGDSAWIAGGFEGHHPGRTIADVWRYDRGADRWTPGPPLPAPRAAGTLVRRGRTLHYVGGFSEDRDTTHGDHWVLDLDAPSGWEARAPLPCPRGHLGGVAFRGEIFALGGQYGHDRDLPEDLDCAHVYRPEQDRWEPRAALPSGRSHFEPGVFVWKDRIVLVGGRNLQHQPRMQVGMREVTIYDPATDRWSEAPRLPEALLAPVAVPLDGGLFVTMGSLQSWRKPQATSYWAPFPLPAESDAP